jgi:hypothetical protein
MGADAGPCGALQQKCTADVPCSDYYQCVLQCPETTGFATCAVDPDGGCNGSPFTDPNYVKATTCECGVCKDLCPELCK